jgi:hypothetical protein
MLQRTGEAETITTHYLFALGAYRALYIPNWVYRWAFDVKPFRDPIAVVAGIIQTVLYSDFFYIYYTKYVTHPHQNSSVQCTEVIQGRPRQEVQPAGMNKNLGQNRVLLYRPGAIVVSCTRS